MATARRLVLAAPPGAPPEPPPSWAPACKLSLGIDEDDARRLWAKLPVTLTIPPIDDALFDEALRRLQKTGAGTTATPFAFKAERCARHRRAAADAVCPKCGERRACALCLNASSPALCPPCAGRSRFFTTFRRLRIAILLTLLVLVALVTWNDNRRVTSWRRSLVVTVVPVDASGDPNVARWIATLTPQRFAPVTAFFEREAARYGLTLEDPVRLQLASAISEAPPREPEDLASRLQIAAWSLKLRWWSWRTDRRHGFPSSAVRVYVLYEKDGGQLPEESLGLKQGRIGIVRTLAGERESGWTNVTIAHEVLHTLGATDKYQPDGMPVFPDGYAEPQRRPAIPQSLAEVMAGQIPLTRDGFVQARSLDQCLIGRKTAEEIGWKKFYER